MVCTDSSLRHRANTEVWNCFFSELSILFGVSPAEGCRDWFIFFFFFWHTRLRWVCLCARVKGVAAPCCRLWHLGTTKETTNINPPLSFDSVVSRTEVSAGVFPCLSVLIVVSVSLWERTFLSPQRCKSVLMWSWLQHNLTHTHTHSPLDPEPRWHAGTERHTLSGEKGQRNTPYVSGPFPCYSVYGS